MSDQHAEHGQRGAFRKWGAIFVALLVLYISSWLGLWWAHGEGLASERAFDALQQTVYRPIWWYMKAGLPGGHGLFQWAIALSNSE